LTRITKKNLPNTLGSGDNRKPKLQSSFLVEIFSFSAIFSVAAFLRFTKLGHESLWSDELFSVSTALSLGDRPWFSYVPKFVQQLTYDDSFLTRKVADYSPPLYEVLLFVWSQLFGQSEFALRSMSAIGGLLAVLVMYFGLRKILKPVVAMAAASLLAFSPGAIFYSMEARSYSLTLLLATLATVRLTRAYLGLSPQGIKKLSSPNWKDITVLILLSYSHYTGLVVAACLAVIHLILISMKTDIIKDSLRFLLVPLALAPWFLLTIRTLESSVSGAAAWKEYGTEEIIFGMLAPASTFLLPIIGYLPAWIALFMLACSASISSTLNSTEGLRRRISKEVTLSLMFFLILTALFIFSLNSAFSVGMWSERYFLAGLPVGIISLILLSSRVTYSNILKILILILLLTSTLTVTVSNASPHPHKEDYRGASSWITSNLETQSLIVMGWPANESFYRYYLDRDLASTYPKPGLESVASRNDVVKLCNGVYKSAEKVFFIQHQTHIYWEYFSDCQYFTKNGHFNFNGIEVIRFIKRD